MSGLWQVLMDDDDSVGHAQLRDDVDEGPAWDGVPYDDWEPADADLVDGDWADYLGGDILNLCSDGLKAAIDGARHGDEPIQWLEHRVHGAGGVRRYWALLVHDAEDRLDAERSDIVAGQVVRPAFRQDAVGALQVVGLPGYGASAFVGDSVAEAIRAGGFSGVALEPVDVG